jgi:hypothetical protein
VPPSNAAANRKLGPGMSGSVDAEGNISVDGGSEATGHVSLGRGV